jgi:hypothetical protein
MKVFESCLIGTATRAELSHVAGGFSRRRQIS